MSYLFTLEKFPTPQHFGKVCCWNNFDTIVCYPWLLLTTNDQPSFNTRMVELQTSEAFEVFDRNFSGVFYNWATIFLIEYRPEFENSP
jgi:hypothetical protein